MTLRGTLCREAAHALGAEGVLTCWLSGNLTALWSLQPYGFVWWEP